MKILQGKLLGRGMKIGIVVSALNKSIALELLTGTLETLKKYGIKDEYIAVAWVPSDIEIPLVAKKMANNEMYDAVICLGVITKGSISYFDYVCLEVCKAISVVSLSTEKPVINGILITNTIEEAIEKSRIESENNGYNAAIKAIEMVNLLDII